METTLHKKRGRKLAPGRTVSSEARYQTVRNLRTRVPNEIADRVDGIMPGVSQYAKVRELIVLGLEAYESRQTPK